MKVFILEDDLTRMALFYEALIGHEVVHADNVEDAIDNLKHGPFDLFLLDHDLGGCQMVSAFSQNTGLEFVSQEEAQDAMMNAQVIVHSYNPQGAAAMVANSTAVWIPFGRKLLNMLAEEK